MTEGNHERSERPSAAFGRNQVKGKKLWGKKIVYSEIGMQVPKASFLAPEFLP